MPFVFVCHRSFFKVFTICHVSLIGFLFHFLNLFYYTYSEKPAEKRAEYQARIKRVSRAKRVYADESGIHTYLQREYARSLRGTTVEQSTPGKQFDRVNVTGALCAGEHSAIECYRHTADSAFFEQRFETGLLEQIPQGCGYTIIMYNAGFRSKKRLRKLAGGKARLLFLPPYSPDYNPIEQSWANMKRFLSNNLRDFNPVDYAIYDYFHVPVN